MSQPFTEGSPAARANQEPFVNVAGPRTGTEFPMRAFTYGVLDPDAESPLSRVSVANSSLSVDLWSGCAWQCSYCHVQDGVENLDPITLTMPNRPRRTSNFSVEQVVDAMVEHPFFEPDKTVISIGTASTEPFARGPVSDSTFEIMEHLVSKGFKNPFWVVTKAGFPSGYEERLSAITTNGNPFMLSVCWANNPKDIEPIQTDRFRNLDQARRAGAKVSWYLRPLASAWSADPDRLRETFEAASLHSTEIDMIIPGGLRWTPGIEYGVVEIRNQKMPDIPKDDNVKELSDETWDTIHELAAEFFPGKPVLHKSSCGLSNMLGMPNHNLVQRQQVGACLASVCPIAQREICMSYTIPSPDELQKRLSGVGLGEIAVLDVDPVSGRARTEPPVEDLTFALRHMVEIQSSRE